MTREERASFRWLRRELALELGMRPPRRGRPWSLTARQEEDAYQRLQAAPRRHRCRVMTELAEEFGVSVRVFTDLLARRRREQSPMFRVEHVNSHEEAMS